MSGFVQSLHMQSSVVLATSSHFFQDFDMPCERTVWTKNYMK